MKFLDGLLAAQPLPIIVTMTFVIFLIPTCAMGATLPVLVTELTSRTGNVGVSTGNLYFVNTLGVALGAYAASDLLLPRWGLDGLTLLAAALNFSISIATATFFKSIIFSRVI